MVKPADWFYPRPRHFSNLFNSSRLSVSVTHDLRDGKTRLDKREGFLTVYY
jgi:hypothetical protein